MLEFYVTLAKRLYRCGRFLGYADFLPRRGRRGLDAGLRRPAVVVNLPAGDGLYLHSSVACYREGGWILEPGKEEGGAGDALGDGLDDDAAMRGGRLFLFSCREYCRAEPWDLSVRHSGS